MSSLECPFCKDPGLFHIDFSDLPDDPYPVAAKGQFWKRIQNDVYPRWPIPGRRRDLEGLHSLTLIGSDHFAPRWELLTVEILGTDFLDKPAMPPIPLFGVTSIGDVSFILWHACKITHKDFSFVVNVHWWPSHGRIFTVEKFDFESTKAREALSVVLSMFAKGRGKPSEYFQSNKQFFEALKAAVMRRHDEGTPAKFIQAIEIAEELFPEANDSGRTLRRWLQSSWRRWRWKDIVSTIIENGIEARNSRGHNSAE